MLQNIRRTKQSICKEGDLCASPACYCRKSASYDIYSTLSPMRTSTCKLTQEPKPKKFLTCSDHNQKKINLYLLIDEKNIRVRTGNNDPECIL